MHPTRPERRRSTIPVNNFLRSIIGDKEIDPPAATALGSTQRSLKAGLLGGALGGLLLGDMIGKASSSLLLQRAMIFQTETLYSGLYRCYCV
jgi:predicted lipid-binding transport protein (Tim44 family)